MVVEAQQTVVGYYTLAAGAVSHQSDPVPVMVLARLAVDQRAQGLKLGASLSQHVGIRALLVHALHDRAKQFYEHYGFQASTIHPMTLLLRLQQN